MAAHRVSLPVVPLRQGVHVRLGRHGGRAAAVGADNRQRLRGRLRALRAAGGHRHTRAPSPSVRLALLRQADTRLQGPRPARGPPRARPPGRRPPRAFTWLPGRRRLRGDGAPGDSGVLEAAVGDRHETSESHLRCGRRHLHRDPDGGHLPPATSASSRHTAARSSGASSKRTCGRQGSLATQRLLRVCRSLARGSKLRWPVGVGSAAGTTPRRA